MQFSKERTLEQRYEMKEVREEVAQAEGVEGMKGPGKEVERGECRRWDQNSCGGHRAFQRRGYCRGGAMAWSGWDEGSEAAVARDPQELMVAWNWWCQGGERLILGLVKVEPTDGCGGYGG